MHCSGMYLRGDGVRDVESVQGINGLGHHRDQSFSVRNCLPTRAAGLYPVQPELRKLSSRPWCMRSVNQLAHIQLLLAVLQKWPEELVALARQIKALFSFDISMLTQSPECSLNGKNPFENWISKWLITQGGIWILLIFFILLRTVIFGCLLKHCTKRRYRNHCMNAITTMYCLVRPLHERIARVLSLPSLISDACHPDIV